MKKSDVLDIIELLDADGWIKNTYHTSKGYCLLGAANKISEINGEQIFMEPVYKIIAEQYPNECDGWIHHWNDHPDRTYEEVIAILEKTAASLDD